MQVVFTALPLVSSNHLVISLKRIDKFDEMDHLNVYLIPNRDCLKA